MPTTSVINLKGMAANNIDSDQYVDGSIDTVHIGDDQVTGAKLNPALVSGDIIYADGTDTINRLAKPGTPAGEVLTFATSASAPSWVAAAGASNECLVKLSSNQTISTSTTTLIAFDTELIDNGGNFSSNTYTAPTAGQYLVILNSGLNAGVDATRVESWIGINGSSSNSGYFAAIHPSTAASVYNSGTVLFDLSLGDTIKPYLWHTSGSDKYINANYARFIVIRIKT